MTVLTIVLIIWVAFISIGLNEIKCELAKINKSIKSTANKENEDKENSNMVIATAHYQDSTTVKFTKEDLK